MEGKELFSYTAAATLCIRDFKEAGHVIMLSIKPPPPPPD